MGSLIGTGQEKNRCSVESLRIDLSLGALENSGGVYTFDWTVRKAQ